MQSMNMLPVLAHDLLSKRHHRRLRKERLTVGAVSGLAVLALASAERWAAPFSIAAFVRAVPLASTGPILLLCVGITLGARLLAAERREGTLPLLLLTQLSGHEILRGKLLGAMTIQVDAFLAAVPALILPMAIAGFGLEESCLMALACVNALFFGLCFGMLAAVVLDEEKAVSGCILLMLPAMALATPVGTLLPAGAVRDWVGTLQWVNPLEAMAHVPTAVAGLRTTAYWHPLLGSHMVAWVMLGLAGIVLPRACRWQGGKSARKTRQGWADISSRSSSFSFRARLLDLNPFLWLSIRYRWATIQIWLYVCLAALLWGWLGWLSWARQGVNILVVLAGALAATWLATLAVAVPAEAARRLVEDRQSGALELLLCTPVSVREIVQGQWLTLRRRYLAPWSLMTLLSLGLMVSGLATDGFGGMLDPEDRGLWVVAWLSGIVLAPLSLIALCWVTLRRTLFARNIGEASGIALFQVTAIPLFALTGASMMFHSLFGWRPQWLENAVFWILGYVAWLLFCVWRARRILFRDIRLAATQRYSASATSR